ncbi:WD repeat-containing protein 43-like [Dermacentor silvarum]|uniref:WD repeat-containing protein 43-like n=1 Tax=Dermacentor silvarum TaxID=543639 RepID=UPI002100899E|nr:WD repeat-containing protein 43-like [Dermacentor silvarum]
MQGQKQMESRSSQVYAVAGRRFQHSTHSQQQYQVVECRHKSIVMKFTGHVTEVRQILPVFVPSKTGEGRTYFLTCAANDRQVSAWHLEKGAGSSSLANFVLSEEAVHISISNTSENSKTAHLSAVTKSGALHIFELQLNGRCRTPVQPKFHRAGGHRDPEWPGTQATASGHPGRCLQPHR